MAFRQGIRHGFPCERENKKDPTIGSLGLQRGLFEGEAGSGHGFSPVKWIGYHLRVANSAGHTDGVRH